MWRLRADLIRVAVPPGQRITPRRGIWLVEDPIGGPYLGVVVQRGSAVRDVEVGQGVIFGAHAGQWFDGDLLIAERDCDAVLEA